MGGRRGVISLLSATYICALAPNLHDGHPSPRDQRARKPHTHYSVTLHGVLNTYIILDDGADQGRSVAVSVKPRAKDHSCWSTILG